MENNTTETIVLKGKVTFAKFGSSRKDNRNMYRLSIEVKDFDIDTRKKIAEAYENAVMIPKFIKDSSCNIINLKSLYDIPVKSKEKEIDSFQKWLDDGRLIDAEISVKCKIKKMEESGAIYPVAIIVRKFGSKYDFFADFDWFLKNNLII